MILHSSMDTTIRICYEDSPEFWQRWRNELSDIGKEIAAARPDLGIFIVNCPFHGTVGGYYDNALIPLLDSAQWASLGFEMDKSPGGHFLDILCCKKMFLRQI